MNTNTPFVSIVTPVYNTAPYLDECIRSVLAQSYQNYEYIISDNCSNDGSFEIAKKYEQQDNRIKVIQNKKHLPQIPNYNRALEYISNDSKYCKIVQADDWIYRQALTELIAVAEKSESIGIVSSYQLKGNRIGCLGLKYEQQIVSGKDVARLHLLQRKSLFGSPTSLLFRADLIRKRQTFYDKESMLPDTEACYQFLKDIDVGFVHQVLAYLRTDNESVTSTFEDFNPYLLHECILLKRYGEQFLNGQEVENRYHNMLKNYFSYLGEMKLRKRSDAFWNYHRNGLRILGYSTSSIRIYWAAIVALLDILFNPLATFKQLVNRFRRTSM